MIAILTSEIEVVNLSSDIHDYLIKNRKGYNAKKWSDLNKSDYENLWLVKVHEDYPTELELVKYPEQWKKPEL